MRIIAVRERPIPIASGISNAYITFSSMSVSLVAVATDEWRRGQRVIGYGFNSNGRYAQSGLLRERFIPRLLGAGTSLLINPSSGNIDPIRAWSVMMENEKPGGHGDRSVAVGVLDMALWDIASKLEEKPLAHLLAERTGAEAPATRVPVYAAGGYYQINKGIAALREEMLRYLDMGYTSLKVKIGGTTLDEDRRRIDTVLSLLPSSDLLAVDANARFTETEALAYARALAPLGLRWYEEPGDPLDFALCARVAGQYEPPLATGENLFAAVEVKNLLTFGGLRPDRDVLQMDPALSYGLVEYLRMLQVVNDCGWTTARCIPHGGHQMNLAIAAALRLGGIESYPELFRPFGGFADGQPVVDGYIGIVDNPGIGIEANSALRALAYEVAGDLR